MRYIGNKTKLLGELENFIRENRIDGEIFCDLFSGTSSVGDLFKYKYKIISNDFLKFSSDIAKGKLLNNKIPEFIKFKKKYKTDPFNYFNEKNYSLSDHFFITKHFSPLGNRQYFTEENALKIDGIRFELEDLYKIKILNEKEYFFLLASLLESATKFSNTSGTYEAYLKKWDSRSLKYFKIKPLELNISENRLKECVFFNRDANHTIREIKGDILYIDPPYTTTEYSSAYHVLETISKIDSPEIRGITGRRTQNELKSSYTRKQSALFSFEDLIRQAQFKHIIISYSNESLIPIEVLSTMLKKYSIDKSIVLKKISYRTYKNLRESKKSDSLHEYLIYLHKNNELIKSPLNYSGSKDKLLNQIVKYLPEEIDTFIDVMGGAFNVGSNVVANKVVYNEINKYVFEIVKKLIEESPENILNHVKKQISMYNLQKSNKITYTQFRNYYNKTKNILDLFVLSTFCFQNQLRFNSSFEFNTPVGNCAFNKTIEERIVKFKPKTKNIEFLNLDFQDLDFRKYSKKSLFYFDPPYYITNATYNDGKRGFKGWNETLEINLLKYLNLLDSEGYKFMLSNTIYHKGKVNHNLKTWADTNRFNIYEIKCNIRKEVLITNYSRATGIRK